MLYQKFSGCGTCSGRDTEIHTTVVEHSDPADYHYDTSIDDRFKTYKHDGGGTNALAMPHGPRELIVLEETKRTELRRTIPFHIRYRRKHSRIANLQPGKELSRPAMMAAGQTFRRAQRRQQVQSVSCDSSNTETKHYILNLFVIFRGILTPSFFSTSQNVITL
jgi:hypothetical protein